MDFVPIVFEHELVKVILMHIREVLHEEHDEDLIPVLRRVHGATERVTGFPEDVIDFVLGDGGGLRQCHAKYLSSHCIVLNFINVFLKRRIGFKFASQIFPLANE